jgi:superfamily II DNA/RNA helicase
MIIFVRTKHWADKLYRNIRSEKQLKLDFFKAGVLHGDLSQSKREFIMRQFNEQEINCLIATNVAARGLDFTQVSHVFNYDFPDRGDAVDEYVHRIGRTARIDCKNNGITTKGIAISLVLKNQLDVLKDIEVKIKRKLVQKSLPEIKEIHEYNDPQFKRVQRSNQIHPKHSNNKSVHANRHDTNNKNNKNKKNYKNNKNPKTHSDQEKKSKNLISESMSPERNEKPQ